MGGLVRHLVSFFTKVLVGELGVKELFLDTFFLSGVCGLILVRTGNSNGVVEGRF